MSPLLPKGHTLRSYIEMIEYQYIVAALGRANGCCAHAAVELGIGRTTLVEKRKRYGLLINRPIPRGRQI